MNKKCKYSCICEHYDKTAVTCNKNPDDYCGIYRQHRDGVI